MLSVASVVVRTEVAWMGMGTEFAVVTVSRLPGRQCWRLVVCGNLGDCGPSAGKSGQCVGKVIRDSRDA